MPWYWLVRGTAGNQLPAGFLYCCSLFVISAILPVYTHAIVQSTISLDGFDGKLPGALLWSSIYYVPSTGPVISPQKVVRLVGYNLSMVNPRRLFPAMFLPFICFDTASRNISSRIFLGTSDKADRTLVPWIFLLVLFKNGHDIRLFPLLWLLWPFKGDRGGLTIPSAPP